jgi:acetyl esterase/lipase
MNARVHFRGPPRYRLRSAAELSQSVLEVSARRMLKGPRRPGWNWFVEVATRTLKKQVSSAFKMRDVKEARRYLDSMVTSSPALSEVNIRQVVHEKFRGSWFSGKNAEPRVTVMYFHGGGYSFYPRAYASFIAQITLAAKSRTFALNYRLSPEHRFPAQLEDALNAYRWLLENGTDPDNLVLTDDSAGGNLTFALLLAARGRAEILYDSIQAFADRGKNPGADVVLETWENMNHDFQIFGLDAPQSAEALRRVGEVIDARIRARSQMGTINSLPRDDAKHTINCHSEERSHQESAVPQLVKTESSLCSECLQVTWPARFELHAAIVNE